MSCEFQLENYQDKCRFCLRAMKAGQKTVEISNAIEKRFESLTNSKLIMSECYSSVICESCNSKLSEFSDFQAELIENQTKLYELIEQLAPDEDDAETNAEHYEVKIDDDSKYSDELFVIRVEDDDETEATISHEVQQSTCIKRPRSSVRSTAKDGVVCSLCGVTFSRNGWYHHKLRAHSDNFRFFCDFCGRGYHVKNDLKDHIKTHMSVESRKKFPCTTCGASLLSLKALTNHEMIFHSDIIEEHPCECGKVFSSKAKLYHHRTAVHNEETFPCSACGKVYKTKSTLSKHTIKVHGRKVPCNVCGKMLAPGMFMNRHLKTHGPPQFKCAHEECTKVFANKASLENHVETCHDQASVSCPTCNVSCSSARNLNRHIARQHSTTRMHCEVDGCSHSTARKDYLRAHYRSHKEIDETTRNILIEKVKSLKAISW